jgi:hypothetical protein
LPVNSSTHFTEFIDGRLYTNAALKSKNNYPVT